MLQRIKNFFTKGSDSGEDEYLPLEDQPDNWVAQDGPWIGVDLDGTLAKHDLWVSKFHIGKPVPQMMKRVKNWIDHGIRVKIVTARASDPEGIPPVKSWLKKQGLPELEVTNEKDFSMIELWDDRAIQVIPNTGRPVLNGTLASRPKAPVGDIE
jgi:hypothetical protein